jgi:hypothetical protein
VQLVVTRVVQMVGKVRVTTVERARRSPMCSLGRWPRVNPFSPEIASYSKAAPSRRGEASRF